MGKSKQKISNWKLYNLALVKRGSLTLWMDEQAIKHWHCQTHHGRRGRGFHYSDRAIDTAPWPTCSTSIPRAAVRPYTR